MAKSNDIEQLLFYLLRVGLRLQDCNTNSPTKYSLENLMEVKNLADIQGVSALVFDGVQAVYNSNNKAFEEISKSDSKWKEFIHKWTSLEWACERRNKQQLEIIGIVADIWKKEGIKMLVFKGASNASFYPNPLHRSVGDIDCYLFGDAQKGDNILESFGAHIRNNWYRHSKIGFKGETIENHRVVSHTREGRKSKYREHELINSLNIGVLKALKSTNAFSPTASFNARFLTYHAMRHFLAEGLRLKQIVDWAMFLKEEQSNIDWPDYYAFCEKYHLRRFTDAMTMIAVKFFNVCINVEGVTKESPYAERILHSTLYDQDYIFNSGKGGWNNRMHIVCNMLKRDRWKYRDIYGINIYKQLWYYATGYLFKTE